MAYTVNELAELVGGEVTGDGAVEIRGAASAGSGKPGEISFVLTQAHLGPALEAQASCLIVPPGLDAGLDAGNVPAIVVAEPKLAFARVLEALYPRSRLPEGVHTTAAVDPGAALGKGVRVGAHVCIQDGVRLEDGVEIGAGSIVETGAYIGRDSVLHSRVVVGARCVLGERVELHSGVVIGADGFGYVTHEGVHQKFPQVGHVVIGDDVEIGANSTVDRGALDPTRIGSGTKIDNLVQIAHNVQVGENCMICALCGLAGSAVIGNGVILAGEVTFGDHAGVGDGGILLARTGVPPGKTLEGGQAYWGAPPKPIKEAMRLHGSLSRVPKALQRLTALERQVQKLAEDD